MPDLDPAVRARLDALAADKYVTFPKWAVEDVGAALAALDAAEQARDSWRDLHEATLDDMQRWAEQRDRLAALEQAARKMATDDNPHSRWKLKTAVAALDAPT